MNKNHWIAADTTWDRGINRVTNGSYSIELVLFFDNPRPQAVVEWPNGLTTYHYFYGDGGFSQGDYTPPNYVMSKAASMLGSYYYSHNLTFA